MCLCGGALRQRRTHLDEGVDGENDEIRLLQGESP
jgi:hypothetical protein